VIPGDTIYL